MRNQILAAATLVLAATALQAQELPPASPTDFTTQFEVVNGKGVVKGQFTAPTMSNDYGNPQPLGRISEIVVTRSCWSIAEYDVQVARFEQAIPGKVYSFKDETITTYGYGYSYSVKAMNADGEGGYGASSYSFAGLRPAQPEFIEVATQDMGLPPITFTFKASDLDEDGKPLGIPLTAIHLSFVADDDNETSAEIGTITDPEPGKAYSLTFDATPGMSYNFKLTAECEFGIGDSSSYSLFVGEDAPGAAADITVTPLNGGAEIKWTAPEKGRHNGWLNTANTRYKVERAVGSDYKVLAESIAECSFFDSCEDLTGQTSIKYRVTSFNEIGEGEPVNSESIIIGPAASLPFAEHFNKETYYSVEADNLWFFEPSDWSGNWNMTRYEYASGGATGVNGSADTEEGYAYCSHSYSSAETHDRMISSDISLENAIHPVLTFYYLARTGADNRLEVAYSSDNEETQLMDFCISDRAEEVGDLTWVRSIAPIAEAAGKNVNIIMHAYRAEEGNFENLCVDEILLDDYPPVEVFSSQVDGNVVTVSWVAPENSTGKATEYEVSIDGAEPITVTENMTDVTVSDDSDHTISVKAIYGDVPSCVSEAFRFNRQATGILGVTAEGSHTEYYDLTGARRHTFSAGEILIRRTIDPNGNVTVSKVVM